MSTRYGTNPRSGTKSTVNKVGPGYPTFSLSDWFRAAARRANGSYDRAEDLLESFPSEVRFIDGETRIVRTCFGCHAWQIDYLPGAYMPYAENPTHAAQAIIEHRADCRTLDTLLALRLPIGWSL